MRVLTPAAALLVAWSAATPAAWAKADDVEVSIEKFGVGNSYRPGEFAGIRLELTDIGLGEATPIWVQIEVPNADGDIAEYGRSLTLSPGQQLATWLYIPVPPEFDNSTPLAVRIFEERGGRRRGEIGGDRVSPSDAGAVPVDITASMLAIAAGQRLGLDAYRSPQSMTGGLRRSANEETMIVAGLALDDMPDRWEALKGFEAIVWGETGFRVSELTDNQVEALREYIERGGHLVISLPDAGNPWGLGEEGPGQSRFHDVLPPRAPQRQESIPLRQVLPAISKSTKVPEGANFGVTVHVFRRLGGGEEPVGNGYQPLIALADGRVIAIQRPYGFGRITLLGLDLTRQRLLSVGAIQADVLWNRILGRRVDTPTGQELFEMTDRGMLSSATPGENNLGGGQLFEDLTNMSQAAGRGLGTALLLFIIYWIAAGPGGFYAWNQYRLERHAWLAFAAAASLFTAVAWGIVSLIKPSAEQVKHVTYLDILAEGAQTPETPAAPRYRALSLMSVNLPGYRRTPVFLESTDGQRDLLVSWSPPAVLTQPFPNPDRYRVDVGGSPADVNWYLSHHDGLAEFRRPTRATATQLYAHWSGDLDPAWGGIRQDRNDPVRVGVDASGQEHLRGTLIHDLPGDLTDVTIIWVKSNRTKPRRYMRRGEEELPWVPPLDSGRMLNTGRIWRQSPWLAGTNNAIQLAPLDQNTGGKGLDVSLEERYVKQYRRSAFRATAAPGAIGRNDRRNYLEMLSFFHQLEPPAYLNDRPGGSAAETAQFYRSMGREADLSAWFTRPCLIVIGHLEAALNPIPLRVDGEAPEVADDSLTIVRWICPLPLEEKIAFPEAFGENNRP